MWLTVLFLFFLEGGDNPLPDYRIEAAQGLLLALPLPLVSRRSWRVSFTTTR